MKTLREIISENITKLRKQQGLTQIGLAKKINYSDKAISRWEKGEVTPDIETLESLSKIFNVPLSYLIEEHSDKNSEYSNVNRNEIAFQTLSAIAVWTIATILFVFIELYYGKNVWQLFVWAVPATAIVLSHLNRKNKNRHLTFILRTILCWSLITCFYLYYLPFNVWMVFLVGIPIQAAISVSYATTFTKRKNKAN